MTFYDGFNLIEGVLWWGVAALLLRNATRANSRRRRLFLVAALVFGLFGVTDWLEVGRAGQLPLWLWALKVTCGATILWTRYEFRGWHTLRWHDRELLFSAGCLVGVAIAITLQTLL